MAAAKNRSAVATARWLFPIVTHFAIELSSDRRCGGLWRCDLSHRYQFSRLALRRSLADHSLHPLPAMNQQNLSSFIWSVADLLRGDYK